MAQRSRGGPVPVIVGVHSVVLIADGATVSSSTAARRRKSCTEQILPSKKSTWQAESSETSSPHCAGHFRQLSFNVHTWLATITS
jgi:hypothetical protein